jgi:hypothetical protein
VKQQWQGWKTRAVLMNEDRKLAVVAVVVEASGEKGTDRDERVMGPETEDPGREFVAQGRAEEEASGTDS